MTAQLSDPDGSVTARAWDLDDDGEFDDGNGESVPWTFATAGSHRVFVRATDNSGSAVVIVRTLEVGGGPGVPTTAAGGPSTVPLRLMSPFPVVRVAGSLTRRGASLRLVSVLAARGARIEVRCSGKGCARKKLVTKARGKRAKRLETFQKTYRAGARIEVRVSSSIGRIGKYTRITIRKGKKPARVDRCLMPGSAKPTKCPG